MNNLVKPNIKVGHNEMLSCLEVSFSGFITYDELVEAVHYEFEMIRHFTLKKCMINLREISIYPQGGQEYIKTEWFPKIIQLQVKAIAFIVPDDLFGQMSMQEAHSSEQMPITIKYFKHTDEAQVWISEFE